MKIIVNTQTDELLIEAQFIQNLLKQFNGREGYLPLDMKKQLSHFLKQFRQSPKWVQEYVLEQHNLSIKQIQKFLKENKKEARLYG